METWRRDKTNGISGADGLGVGGLGWNGDGGRRGRRADPGAGGGEGIHAAVGAADEARGRAGGGVDPVCGMNVMRGWELYDVRCGCG